MRETFFQVQEVIDGKKKNNPKLSKRINPDLYLRQFLTCPVCGKSLTGSGSRGNGGKYPYYHCSNDGKHFRYRADKANELFANFLSTIKPNGVVLELYKEVLSDIRKDSLMDKKKEVDVLKIDLAKIEERLNKLQDKYIDGEIDQSTFNSAKTRYENEMNQIKEKMDLMSNPNRSNIEPKLKYAIGLINNMDTYIKDEKIEVKMKLISSMFPEKFVFDGKSYRTNSYNSVLDLIHQQTNELRGKEKGENSKFLNFPASVPRAGTQPYKII